MAEKDGALAPPQFETTPRLLIVAAPFYRAVADGLIAGARKVLDGFGAAHETVEVPGALELAPVIGFAGERFDGFVALGCVIRGETTHYETVCEESARGITLLGVERGLCIGNGVLTCENRAQADARADPNRMDKGGGAALAALHLIALKRRFAA
jgi:6,7-dimethyl-8-ribityllumazine synthase